MTAHLQASPARHLALSIAGVAQPFYPVMSTAVGGNFPGVPNPQAPFPTQPLVDGVRVHDPVGGCGETRPRGKDRLPCSNES